MTSFLFFLFAHIFSNASVAAPRPRISNIQGTGARIEGKNGQSTPAKVGDRLEANEKLITNESTSVLLTYGDGSRALIGKSSVLEIPEEKDGVTQNDVHSGSVRALIRKKQAQPGSKYHFLFRSRNAVMGVRGTDLVMSTGEGGATEARIIEGLVDMATNEEQMKAGTVKPLKTGEYLTASSERGLSEPTRYEVSGYLKSLEERQMGLNTYRLDPRAPFADSAEPFTSTETSYSRFRLGAIHVRQITDKGYDYSAILSYSPRLRLSRAFALVVDASLFPLKLGEPRKWTPAYRIGAGLRWNLGGRISIEAGAGREQWGTFTQNGMSYFGNLSWNFRGQSLVRALVFGFGYYDRPAKGSDPKNPSVTASTGLEFGL